MSKEVIPEKAPDPQQALPEVEKELSQVASNPKKNMLILALVVLAFGYLVLTTFFFSDDANKSSENTEVPKNVVKPAEATEESSAPPIPTLPTPPQIDDKAAPPIPPPAPSKPDAPLVDKNIPPALPLDFPIEGGNKGPLEPALPMSENTNESAQQRNDAKRKSSMILIAGTPPKKTPEQEKQEADFKYRGDMHLVLGRGKILDAVVESAINSDYGGEIRAVMSRDVYSEWGKNILIPKGSRLFGTYSAGVSGNYGRVQVEWTRIDLANGYSVNLSGIGIDALGRKGAQGRVDDKFKERFANAVMNSAFSIGVASAVDKVVTPVVSTQAAATQTSTATAIQNLANGIFSQSIAPTATLTVDQIATQKFNQICASVQSSITDKSSTAYTTIVANCASLQANPTSTPSQQLASLMSTINSSTNNLLQNTNNSVTPTKSQTAADDAFKDISETVKKLINEQEFKPTVTIDQGTVIKIYVNRDYVFPKSAVSNVRVSS